VSEFLSYDGTTDKLAINWQKFAQLNSQLKFAFTIRPLNARIFLNNANKNQYNPE